MRASVVTWGLLALVLGGCKADGNTSFSNFEVTGRLTEDCGSSGLLAAEAQLNLRVNLRLVGESAIHWDHGEGPMTGFRDEEGVFRLSHLLRVDMREGDTSMPTCLIDRELTVDGALWGADVPRGFDAEMRHAYNPTADSSCEDLLEGELRIADGLPCWVSYDLEGVVD